MKLTQIAYVSKSRLGPAPAQWRPRVERIVTRAREFNLANDITGYLMFDGVEFAQVLEGDEASIMGTFLRIMADDAHGDVRVLVRAPLISRRFGAWRMGLALREEPMEQAFIRHGFIQAGDLGRSELEPLLALAAELAGEAVNPHLPR